MRALYKNRANQSFGEEGFVRSSSSAAVDRSRYILIMGVSGAGKSTIGRRLAEAIGGTFLDADDFHSEENIQRMFHHQPLTDALRWPWLKAVSEAAIAEMQRGSGPVIIACSALKRSYRDFLRTKLTPLSILHLSGSPALIQSRLRSRQGHFMPAALLDSQFAALEPLTVGEGISLSIKDEEAEILAQALRALHG